MKSIFTVGFVLFSCIHLQSQIIEDEVFYPQPLEEEPCYYSSYSVDEQGRVENLQTEAVMVEEWTTPVRGRIIDFTLIKVDQDLVLLVEIHEDAEEKLQPVCLGSKTKIKVSLRNGNNVNLPQYGPKQCGYVNSVKEDEEYYNITNFGYFLITEKAANQLLASEAYHVHLVSTNYDLNFVLKSEIYDEVNDLVIYPELYFISELECMLNPVIPRD